MLLVCYPEPEYMTFLSLFDPDFNCVPYLSDNYYGDC